MGNKSKCNGIKQDTKWDSRRDTATARQPKRWTSWFGLQSRAIHAVKSVRITGGMTVANLTPQTRVDRQVHALHAMRRLPSPAPVKHELVINTVPQPWQRAAAKRKAA